MLVNLLTASNCSIHRLNVSKCRASSDEIFYPTSIYTYNNYMFWISRILILEEIPEYPYSICRPTTIANTKLT